MSAASPAPKFPFAVSLVPTLKRYPVGALIGLVLTGVVSLMVHVVPSRMWLEIPISLICVPGCMVIERLLDWRFSGKVDARMRHSASAEDARLAMDKLEEYQKRGFISKPDAHKLGGTIARRDVAGGPRPVKGRGPSKKQPKPEPQHQLRPAAGPSSQADSRKPAA